MKIYTSYLTSEKFFYKDCIQSQRDYCKIRDYEYIEIENLEINEESAWRNMRALEGVLMNSKEPIVWIKPSVMIMDPTFTIESITCEPADLIVTKFDDTFLDSILIVGNDILLRKTLDFVWKFRNISSNSDFAFKMIESVTDKFIKPVPPKALVSTWYTYSLSQIEMEIDTSVDFPKLKANDAAMNTMHSPKCIYSPGDFSVDFRNTEHAKLHSKDFNALRKKILDKYQESQKILEDARKYQ